MVRSFQTSFNAEQLEGYQKGAMSYEYRGVLCHKSPIDIAIYIRLLSDQKPATIYEIGSKHGGSALLLRDIARMTGNPGTLISIDVTCPTMEFEADDIRFIEGDAHDLRAVFNAHSLFQLPRPWLVIEDSAHTFSACTAVLEFCAHNLALNEYLVMEDGILDELGLSEKYGGGPNLAIEKFLANKPGLFEIDPFYCDMFGRNFTYNPNGYLRKCEGLR